MSQAKNVSLVVLIISSGNLQEASLIGLEWDWRPQGRKLPRQLACEIRWEKGKVNSGEFMSGPNHEATSNSITLKLTNLIPRYCGGSDRFGN